MTKVTLSNGDARTASLQLSKNSNNLSKTMQRLSSGVRILDADDDNGGKALASKLESVASVYFQGNKNSEDAATYYTVADNATDEMTIILEQIKNYAQIAQQSNLTDSKRDLIESEVAALQTHYNQIVSNTSYNGRTIFASENSSLSILAGNTTITTSVGTSITESTATGMYESAVSLTGPSNNAYSTIVEDFNNDGNLDIVTPTTVLGSGGRVQVFLGNGNGTFNAAITFALTSSVTAFTRMGDAGDVNGDGHQDLVFGDTGDDRIYTLLGNGNGTFKAVISAFGGDGAYLPDIADYNGDGINDVMINGYDAGTVNILIGNGNGTFKAPLTNFTIGQNYGVSSADLNNDGKLDLLTSNYAWNSYFIMIGNGNGTFKASQSFTAAGAYHPLAGDINEDGNTDIFVSDTTNGRISTFLGNGNGTFKIGASYLAYTGAQLGLISSGDINGDGHLDIVTTDVSTNRYSVMLGNGNGSFSQGLTLAGGGYSWKASYGDFDEDGNIDIVGTHANGAQVFYAATETETRSVSVESLSALSVSSGTNAAAAEITAETYLEDLQIVKGAINGALSRYDIAADYTLGQAEGNKSGAEQIRSIDQATELANMIAGRVRVASSVAIFAQANLDYSKVIQLLK